MCTFFVFSCVFSAPGYARDVVIINKPHADTDKRLDFSYDMLHLALQVTEPEYGPYELNKSKMTMIRSRQFTELMKGAINVSVSPPKPGWEQAIRIRYPLQRGIASYRVFLIDESNRDIFKNIQSLDDIKKKRAGADTHWSTTIVMKHHNFHVVLGPNYKTLFKMLALGRFDVFPRGLNEVYYELDIYKQKFPKLMIEEYVALFMYLPTYFYVSPKFPRLAERIEKGLFAAHANGTLDVVFTKHFGDSMRRANLDKRRIFYVENINLAPDMYEHDKPYLIIAPQYSGAIESAP